MAKLHQLQLTYTQIERRLAPFWRGLNDFSESWAEHQLMAAARGLPIPPADQVPPELDYQIGRKKSPENSRASDKTLRNLTIPINSRTHSFNSERSMSLSPHNPSFPITSGSSPPVVPTTTTAPLRSRAKTLASLTTSSKNNSQADMTPQEFQIPKDPFVNGQPVEAYLYKDASECPICFLFHPPYLNTTRCCDQPICSECFVQIKRPDPHPPEHEQPDADAPAVSEVEREAQSDGLLVSEVATCPFCKQPEFGITYVPPPFRRGLTYSGSTQPYQTMSAMASETSLSSTGMSPGPGRRRGTSLSANAPSVVTTDKIRPDWATKLASARAHAARRSAAATALHTAAYLMGGNAQADTRGFGSFGRRTMLRRPTLEADMSSAAQLNALVSLAERHAARQRENPYSSDTLANPFLPPPRGSSSRRSRMDDLEDMMMMEAIRLSLASEEERRKKEEKEAKKEAKKKEKENKKAEKAAKKSGSYSIHSNTSNGGTDGAGFDVYAQDYGSAPAILDDGIDSTNIGKGKGVARAGLRAPLPFNNGQDQSQSLDVLSGTSAGFGNHEFLPPSLPVSILEPSRPSHLRQTSNASSSTSSLVEAASSQAFAGSGTPPGGGAETEPMFNFRSLAAMIGDEEKVEDQSEHVEQAGGGSNARSHDAADGSSDDVTALFSNESPASGSGEADAQTNGKLLESTVGLQNRFTRVTTDPRPTQ